MFVFFPPEPARVTPSPAIPPVIPPAIIPPAIIPPAISAAIVPARAIVSVVESVSVASFAHDGGVRPPPRLRRARASPSRRGRRPSRVASGTGTGMGTTIGTGGRRGRASGDSVGVLALDLALDLARVRARVGGIARAAAFKIVLGVFASVVARASPRVHRHGVPSPAHLLAVTFVPRDRLSRSQTTRGPSTSRGFRLGLLRRRLRLRRASFRLTRAFRLPRGFGEAEHLGRGGVSAKTHDALLRDVRARACALASPPRARRFPSKRRGVHQRR